MPALDEAGPHQIGERRWQPSRPFERGAGRDDVGVEQAVEQLGSIEQRLGRLEAEGSAAGGMQAGTSRAIVHSDRDGTGSHTNVIGQPPQGGRTPPRRSGLAARRSGLRDGHPHQQDGGPLDTAACEGQLHRQDPPYTTAVRVAQGAGRPVNTRSVTGQRPIGGQLEPGVASLAAGVEALDEGGRDVELTAFDAGPDHQPEGLVAPRAMLDRGP